MRRRSVQIAFLVARLVFAAKMQHAMHDSDVTDEQSDAACSATSSSVRLGQYLTVAWLFSVWVVGSELAWIVIGRDPWWSAKRLGVSPPWRARILA
jgi:hypothetical protein